jgi:Immunoglobulin-like domain of bacterial spore germination
MKGQTMLTRTAFLCFALAACSPPAKTAETPPSAPRDQPAPTPTPAPADAKYKPAPAGEITVKAPLAGARVTSPLVAEGSAINTWFFEGQFEAELVVDGQVIVQAPAMQAGDKNWTDPGQVGFRASLNFQVTKETKAELILSEDMPQPIRDDSDERGPARSVRIPIVLVPKT